MKRTRLNSPPSSLKLVPRDIKYPAPGVHGGEIALLASDLLEFLGDLLAVQSPAIRRHWTIDRLLANRILEQGDISECCRVKALPKAQWHVSCHRMRGYITVTGRKGQLPFAMHHRGNSFFRTQPSELQAAPQVRSRRPSRRNRPVKTTMDPDIFDYSPTPPASPASMVGNKPYSVHLHKWAALAVGPLNPPKDLLGVHVCGNQNCICVTHHQLGTELENKQDTQVHGSRPGCVCRLYLTR